MSFFADAGRMYVTNAAGDTVFDTDEALFVVTDKVSGSVVIPQRSASRTGLTNNPVNQNTLHTLSSSINTAADVVRGTFNVTTTQPNGTIVGQGDFNAGGTYMHWLGANKHITNPGTLPIYYLGGMACYTFEASGGTLSLREDVGIQAQPAVDTLTYTTTLLSATFNYDLFVGTFV